MFFWWLIIEKRTIITTISFVGICSSPIRSPIVDSEVVMMNMLYKERFPKVFWPKPNKCVKKCTIRLVINVTGHQADGGET